MLTIIYETSQIVQCSKGIKLGESVVVDGETGN